MGGKKVDLNKMCTVTGLTKVEKFKGFLIKFPLLPCYRPHWKGHMRTLS